MWPFIIVEMKVHTNAMTVGNSFKYTSAYLTDRHDEEYRRRILTQLNRGEGRHSVAMFIPR